jgi:hypothetical protein
VRGKRERVRGVGLPWEVVGQWRDGMCGRRSVMRCGEQVGTVRVGRAGEGEEEGEREGVGVGRL